MPKASPSRLVDVVANTFTLRAAAAPTTSFVASDYVECHWFDRVVLLVSYTKGDSTAVEIRPEVSNNGDAASPTWRPYASTDTNATTGSTTTSTDARDVVSYTHSGSLATDVDNIAIDLYDIYERSLTANFFRVQVRVTGASTGSPSITIESFFRKTSQLSYNALEIN